MGQKSQCLFNVYNSSREWSITRPLLDFIGPSKVAWFAFAINIGRISSGIFLCAGVPPCVSKDN